MPQIKRAVAEQKRWGPIGSLDVRPKLYFSSCPLLIVESMSIAEHFNAKSRQVNSDYIGNVDAVCVVMEGR
jgi:hypothetical protein